MLCRFSSSAARVMNILKAKDKRFRSNYFALRPIHQKSEKDFPEQDKKRTEAETEIKRRN